MADKMSAATEAASTPQAENTRARAVPLGHLLAEKVSQLTATIQASKTNTPSDEDQD